ncbi:aminotransferase class I/II-fold pyridoxal phosphate-dependent enzyme [Kitasatospora sp. NPDC058046]|uniref:aminotransferase class I/II-fold pyridoxal phosphate-dependent enzyme n=1 Tax=Kitasatospora sp. NPDC058046 TaxID=3346312 RepID=UPI0036DDC66C
MTTDPEGCHALGLFSFLRGPHLLERVAGFETWRRPLAVQGRWGYHHERSTHHLASETSLHDEFGHTDTGVNLLSQDYLALSRHPQVLDAVAEALERYGPHAAGSAVVAGETVVHARLREALAQLTGMAHVVLFPTGWGASHGAVESLVGRHDHVLVDELAHASLQQGITSCNSSHVTRVPHLDNEAVREQLRRIRAEDSHNAILMVTESLFSMNSDTPDLHGLQQVCREYGAVLLVDQAHDLGVMGPNGHGLAAIHKVHGELDLVVGSFSKAFATNGGYIATHSEAVAQYVRYFGSTHMFSSALTPLQAAGALAAAQIMSSPEGQRRRNAVLDNSIALRAALTEAPDCTVLGSPSPIVPVDIPDIAAARTALRLAREQGVLLHVVEFPIVPLGHAYFRLQLNSDHRRVDLVQAARVISESITEALSHHKEGIPS